MRALDGLGTFGLTCSPKPPLMATFPRETVGRLANRVDIVDGAVVGRKAAAPVDGQLTRRNIGPGPRALDALRTHAGRGASRTSPSLARSLLLPAWCTQSVGRLVSWLNYLFPLNAGTTA